MSKDHIFQKQKMNKFLPDSALILPVEFGKYFVV